MTNPPQEPGESGPEPEESGEATSEQEAAVAGNTSGADPTELPESTDPEADSGTEPKAESDSESDSKTDTETDTESDPKPDDQPTAPQPPAEAPPKSRKGRVMAIALVVALVLAGGGVAVYLVNRGDQTAGTTDRAGSASSTRTSGSSESETTSSDDVYDDYYDDYGSSTESSSDYEEDYGDYEDYGDFGDSDEPEREVRDINDGAATSDDPDEVRLAYMAAYENKEFSEIIENSCEAYQDRFGTDTQELEDALAGFDVIATEDGDLDVKGRTATGLIDIELSSDDNSDTRKILVKLVEEQGKWRFCGEDEG